MGERDIRDQRSDAMSRGKDQVVSDASGSWLGELIATIPSAPLRAGSSTARPDAPKGDAEEKVGSLCSG